MLIRANEERSLLRAAYMRKFCHWAINEDYFRRELFLIGSLGGDKANATGPCHPTGVETVGATRWRAFRDIRP